jgi:hypothetical protein
VVTKQYGRSTNGCLLLGCPRPRFEQGEQAFRTAD